MLRLMGGLLLIGGAAGLGIWYAKGVKERIECLRLAVYLFAAMEHEIAYARTPMSELCKRIAVKMPEPFQGFLEGVWSDMENRDFYISWQNNLFRLSGMALQKSDMEIIAQMGSQAGFFNAGAQAAAIAALRERLEGVLQKAQEEMEKKSRLYLCFGISGGAFLVILLL